MSRANTEPDPDMVEFHRLLEEVRRRMLTWEMRCRDAEAKLAKVTAERDRLLRLSGALLPEVEVG